MNNIDPYTELAYFYDILEDDTYDKYIEMLIQSINERFPNLNQAILAEIGGGTGLVAYRIFDKVKKLIFIEPSEHMLNAAKAKLVPTKHTNIEFKNAGFPNCGLENESVDIIISINDPFQYLLTLEEQVSTLEDLYKSLKHGGLLLIDNKNFFSLIKKYTIPEVTQVKYQDRMYTYVNSHEVLPLKEQWIHTYHFFVENLSTGDTHKYESRHVLKMISPTEMRLLFDKIGFTNIEITTHPLAQEHEATRMWCFARKPENG